MPNYKNVTTEPLDIGGRPVPPGTWADLDAGHPDVREHVDAGHLVAPQPAEPTPSRVPRARNAPKIEGTP